MSMQGTRRSILKRRSGTRERLIAYAQRTGIVLAIGAGVMWLGAWVVLSGAGSAMIDGAKNKIMAKSAEAGFRVANVYIEGRHYTDPQSLKDIINVERGDPLFVFDVEEAQNLIERLSWVKSAEVKRQLPDTIHVRLIERQPFALWQNKGRIVVIDDEGAVLTSDTRAPEFTKLLVLAGEDVPAQARQFITMLQGEPDIYNQTDGATLISGRRWDLSLKNGIIVKLPETDMGLALSTLARAQDEDALLDKNIAAVDLREADRFVIETKPGAVSDYLNKVTPAGGGAI